MVGIGKVPTTVTSRIRVPLVVDIITRDLENSVLVLLSCFRMKQPGKNFHSWSSKTIGDAYSQGVTLQVGDIVYYQDGQYEMSDSRNHAAMVYSIASNGDATFIECWGGSNNKIARGGYNGRSGLRTLSAIANSSLYGTGSRYGRVGQIFRYGGFTPVHVHSWHTTSVTWYKTNVARSSGPGFWI